MFKNHFKIAFRNLVRYKNHTIMNIGGLAVGIAVCLLIFIIIQFELSFDNYHEKKDRVYRVLTEYHHSDAPEIFYGKGVPFALPRALKTSFPQIEHMSTVYANKDAQLMVLDDNGNPIEKFKEEKGVFFTEPALFDIFDFKWLAGTAASLKNPNAVVLTKETADKYFGNWQNAMDKTLKWNNRELLKVTGILESIPNNSDLQFKVIVSTGTGFTSRFLEADDWESTSNSFGCFVVLPNNVSVSSVNNQLKLLSREMKSEDNKDLHVLQALDKIHFDTQVGNFSGKTVSSELINVLWIVAAFILLIACVNFINLSTAQTVNRFKEIGVRKVLGSNKLQLKMQFLMETFLIVAVSVLLAVVIVLVSLKQLGNLLDLPLTFHLLYTSEIYLFLITISIVVTLLAGFYPSMVFSRFSPIDALKNKLVNTGSKGIALRRGLVVFQFAIAQTLIIGTIIIVKQMDYFMNQPLGFEKDTLVNIAIPRDSISLSKVDYLRNQLASVKGVQHVSFSSDTPISDGNNWSNFIFNKATEKTDFYVIGKGADYKYLPTYKMPLVAGRNFRELNSSQEFIVNETLLKKLGIADPEQAINKEINLWNGEIVGPIVGVVKDFHARSFENEIDPVMLTPEKSWYSQAGIKLESDEVLGTLKVIEKIWDQTFPNYVFEYHFLDDQVASYYKQEQQISQMYTISAAIAIFLSCLGLFGLASFMAIQRTKEAGIRKVLGATISNIIYSFSKEFVLLVITAFCIASPIAWYFMHNWLQEYVYRIDITWGVFTIGGTAALLIALVTVGYQAIKVAVANPVNSLRTE